MMSLQDFFLTCSIDFKLDNRLTGSLFEVFHPNEFHLDVELTAGNQIMCPVKITMATVRVISLFAIYRATLGCDSR